MAHVDRRVPRVFTENAPCQQLARVDGIGPGIATALGAAVGNAQEFAHGRHRAAGLGLVPRQCSSGGKERLRGSSKRGDRYLRTVLIHGARATVPRARRQTAARSRGSKSWEQRRGKKIATVASANKNARSAWALLTSEAEYRQAA